MCDTTYITVNQRYIQDKDGYDIMISRGGNRYKTVDKFYAYFFSNLTSTILKLNFDFFS